MSASNLPQSRLILIGGFLGAGKTALIGQLARKLAARGQQVGMITNDQVHDGWHLSLGSVTG